jgi:hypothetical protein
VREVRGVLDAGHDRRSPKVLRCVGDDHEPRVFDVWAPVAFACIGKQRDTSSCTRAAVRRRASRFGPHALLCRHGLPERSYYALRHYFLSALVRVGANLETVRELAGHSKLQTTQRYVHATGADHRDAIKGFRVTSGKRKAPPVSKCSTRFAFLSSLSGRPDSNWRPHGPEPCALAKLRYAP